MTRLPPSALAYLSRVRGSNRWGLDEEALTPEEQSSLLQKTLSGVQYAGLTLDKPGAAVRGLLSGLTGGPWGGGLLNLIPFSDAMGMTKPTERVFGRPLLERWGLVPKNRPGLNPTDISDLYGDVAGLAFEITTDPFFWTTGPLRTFTMKGAHLAKGLGPAGKAAIEAAPEAAANFLKAIEPGMSLVEATTPATTLSRYIAQLRAGERGLLGLGPLKLTAFNKPVATALEKLATSAPGRAWRGLFSKAAAARSLKTGAGFSAKVQALVEASTHEARHLEGAARNLLPSYLREMGNLSDEFARIQSHFGKQGADPRVFTDVMRMLGEVKGRLPDPLDVAKAFQRGLELPSGTPLAQIVAQTDEFAGRVHSFFDAMRGPKDAMFREFLDLGGKSGWLEDFLAEHMVRRMSPELQRVLKKRTGMSVHQLTKARNDILRNWPGGSAEINATTRDLLITATKAAPADTLKQALQQELNRLGVAFNPKQGVVALQKAKLGHQIQNGLAEALQEGRITADELASLSKFWFETIPGKKVTRLDRAVRFFRSMPQEVLKTGLYGQDIVDEMFHYSMAWAGKISDMRMMHSFLAKEAGVTVAGGGASLKRLWQQLGFLPKGLETFVHENADTLFAAYRNEIADDLGKFVNSLTVPKEAAKVLRGFAEIQRPELPGILGRLADRIRAAWSGPLTMPYPSFHVRNLGGGFWNSLTDGLVSAKELGTGYMDAIRHARTGQGLKYVDELIAAGGLEGLIHASDIGGPQLARELGGMPQIGLWRGMTQAWKRGTWKPILPGVAEATEEMAIKGLRPAYFKPMEAGQLAYRWVEFVNRAGYYEALRRKGFSAAQAFHWVRRSQFDYQMLSTFERQVARRGVLFYGWIRNNIPYQITKLLEFPGGRSAQTIRLLTQSQRDERNYVPGFLREMMGIRMGGTPEAAHFLRQSGIPIEDLNRFVFRGERPDIGRTIGKLVSQLHPLAIAPVELFAGKQLWSGRELKTLRSPTGALTKAVTGKAYPVAPIDRALALSPASRLMSEVWAGIDPRKSWMMRVMNATTGFKFSTYDVEKLRILDLLNEMRLEAERMPIVHEGRYYYVPKRFEEAAQAPEAKEKIRRIGMLQRELQRYIAAQEILAAQNR